MTIENQEELLRSCVDLYYNRDLSQNDIAKKLYISRSSVSRLLKTAREKGMVRITISDGSTPHSPMLEKIFKEKFSLENVIITADNPHGSSMDLVARSTARYMDSLIRDDLTIAISRGKTLKAVVDRMDSRRKVAIRVVQLIGLMNNPEKNDDEMDIAKLFANAYGGDYYNLYSPFHHRR